MATIPVLRTWAAGEIVTAAEMNANVRDVANFWLARPFFWVQAGVAQSIPNNTDTVVNFTTTVFDQESGWDGTSKYTYATGGLWRHKAYVSNSTPTSGRQLIFDVKTPPAGSPFTTYDHSGSRSNLQGTVAGGGEFFDRTSGVPKGTSVQMHMIQITGGAANTNVAAGNLPFYQGMWVHV